MTNKRSPQKVEPQNLSTGAKAQVLANSIISIQQQIFQVELTRDLNDHKDDDIFADRGKSYEATIQELQDGIDRLTTKHKKLMPIVNEIIKAQSSGDDDE